MQFVKTRHHYDTYDDFFALVEASGYDTCFVDEIQADSDHTYIITPLNGEWNHGWQNPTATIIWWDLEWRLDQPFEQIRPPGVSRIWASDKWYAQQIGAEYVPLGSHPALVNNDTVALNGTQYHCALMMYRDPFRRLDMINRMLNSGIRIAPNAYGLSRHILLRNSQMLVHIHQHNEVFTIAPLRFALAAAYRLPMLSEQCSDMGIFQDTVLQVQYDGIPPFVYSMSRQAQLLDEYAQRLHNLLCVENTFKSFVENAL